MPSLSVLTSDRTVGVTTGATTASVATTADTIQLLCVGATPESTAPAEIQVPGWQPLTARNFNPGDLNRFVAVFQRVGTGTSISATINTKNNAQYLELRWVWLECADVSEVRQVVSAIGNSGTPSVTLGAFGNASNATLEIIASASVLNPTVGTGYTQLAEVQGTVQGDFLTVGWQNANDTSVDASGTGSDFWGIVGLELVAGTYSAPTDKYPPWAAGLPSEGASQTIGAQRKGITPGLYGDGTDLLVGESGLFLPARGGGVALTGVSATGSVGSVGVSRENALTGVQGSAATGSVGVTVSTGLAGVSASSETGSLGVARDAALTGVAGTAQAGTVTAGTTVALTGVQATGQVGTVTASLDTVVAITGVQAVGQLGSLSAASSVPLTGTSGTGQPGTVASTLSKGVSGLQASGSAGSVGVSTAVALAGVQGSGQGGSVSILGDVTVALTGVSATGHVGSVGVQNDGAINGGGWFIPPRRKAKRAQEEAEVVELDAVASTAPVEPIEPVEPKKTRSPKRVNRRLIEAEEQRALEAQSAAARDALLRSIEAANRAAQIQDDEEALLLILA